MQYNRNYFSTAKNEVAHECNFTKTLHKDKTKDLVLWRMLKRDNVKNSEVINFFELLNSRYENVAPAKVLSRIIADY